MRAAIFGSGGMLGQALVAALLDAGQEVYPFDRVACDIVDRGAVDAACARANPEVLFNCAAFTKVDDCENRAAHAFAVNGKAVGNLAGAAAAVGARLVQVSTDFVFDGAASRAYREDDLPAPLSVYGASKLEGERQAALAPRHTIVRTSWLFGPGGWNFVEAIRKQLDAGRERLAVVADQRGCPTYTPYLARALAALAAAECNGVVHYANPPAVSWHGFAHAIVRVLGGETPVDAITSASAARPALRPASSVLDSTLFVRLTGIQPPSWESGLAEYLS